MIACLSEWFKSAKYPYLLRGNRSLFLLTLVCSSILVLAPSHQSLWIDEALVARVAMSSGNLSGWIQMTLHDPDSEFFKPGFTLSATALAHLFGTSEYGFRMGNITWGILAVFGLAIAGKKIKTWWLPLVFAVHPFVWFYMDELRPYMMQLAAASWMLTSLLYITDVSVKSTTKTVWTNVFWFASFCCYSANMLGALSIASCLFGLSALYLWRRQWPPRQILLWSIPWIVIHAALSLYFLRCMIAVHGAAGAELWPPSVANVGFAAYELLGFMGFGPGRDVIREVVRSDGIHGLLALMYPYLGTLMFYAAITLIACVGVIRSWIKGVNRSWIGLFSLIVAMNVILMLAGALKAGWPFWGRHLSPTLPFLLVLVAEGIAAYNRANKVLIPLWILCLMMGSIHLRYSGENSKDDYRTAATVAQTALSEGKTVWWAADCITANYYHLFLVDNDLPTGKSDKDRSKASMVISKTEKSLNELPTPQLIIISKPDIYDSDGNLQEWIKKRGYVKSGKTAAFSFYTKY